MGPLKSQVASYVPHEAVLTISFDFPMHHRFYAIFQCIFHSIFIPSRATASSDNLDNYDNSSHFDLSDLIMYEHLIG